MKRIEARKGMDNATFQSINRRLALGTPHYQYGTFFIPRYNATGPESRERKPTHYRIVDSGPPLIIPDNPGYDVPFLLRKNGWSYQQPGYRVFARLLSVFPFPHRHTRTEQAFTRGNGKDEPPCLSRIQGILGELNGALLPGLP